MNMNMNMNKTVTLNTGGIFNDIVLRDTDIKIILWLLKYQLLTIVEPRQIQ